MGVTRLAPSPTGALHLGNARTFMVNYLLARQNGWKILLRIEDIDGPRIKTGADQELLEDLRWLGICWDLGPVYQSRRRDLYSSTIRSLLGSRQAYPCTCTRKEIELAASAPHAEDGAAIYPATCRGKYADLNKARAGGRAAAVRFLVPEAAVGFKDGFAGQRSWNPASELGDFVIAKADGTPAYQLAVVVDDAEQQVTHVVRGDDLLDSTPRQILLYRALGLEGRIPAYIHLPLVLGPDGLRLAKRHGDTRLSHYRKLGVRPQRLLALLARWSGIEASESADMDRLIDKFRLENLPREPIRFSGEQEKFLLGV